MQVVMYAKSFPNYKTTTNDNLYEIMFIHVINSLFDLSNQQAEIV